MLSTDVFFLCVCFPESVAKRAVSYVTRNGNVHHPNLGLDGDSDTCFVSGFDTSPWWSVSFDRPRRVEKVQIHGKMELSEVSNHVSSVYTFRYWK